MLRRLLLWLAEITDRAARKATRDDLGTRLAQAEAQRDAWEAGELLDFEEAQRQRAKRRHPANGTP